MQHSESIKELAAALVKAQAALKPAMKDSTNPHFKSKFASLGAVWDACRDALTANGLSVSQLPVSGEQGRVGVTTVLMHQSGEMIAETLVLPLAKQDPQGAGSAITYARRYALAALLGICAEDDDDGHAASQSQPAAQKSPPKVATNGHPRGDAHEGPDEPKTDPAAKLTKDQWDSIKSVLKEKNASQKALLAHFKVKTPADLPASKMQEIIRLATNPPDAWKLDPAGNGAAAC